MRDPDRIPTVLEQLERIWTRHPDWRLGQLVSNIASWADQDVWNLEEEALVREVDRHVRLWDEHLEQAGPLPEEPDRQCARFPARDWLPGFFEQTAGAWQGPLVREDQGQYETREPYE
jgi:hypothetical protein